MRAFVRSMLALASVAMVAPAIAAAQAKPVVAVLYFDNNSIGKDRADYEGVGKGMADLLITEMAANPNLRIVERERIQSLLVEQNLTKQGTIDPTTAIRLGKIIGAQYMITGGFMSDGRGNFVLTARSINVETSAIGNPVRLNEKGDDVLGMIAKLSTKLNSEMKLPALQVGQAGSEPAAMPTGAPAQQAAPQAVAAVAAAEQKPAAAEQKTVKAEPKPAKAETKVARAESRPAGKMDMRTAMLYSKALEEDDAGNKTKAVELYKQVVARFPLPEAQRKIDKYSRG